MAREKVSEPRSFADKLRQLFAKENIPGADETALRRLLRYHELIYSSPDVTDLTRLFQEQDILLKHYLDSALVLKFLPNLPSPLLDIGTGAGFPGMVLKILSPGTEIILGEVRKKRTDFLATVIADLGLEKVTIWAHRVGPQFSLPVNGVITRALETIPETLKRASAFLPQGGRVILMKGPETSEEIREARRFSDQYELEKNEVYSLAGSRHRRSLVVYRRIAEKLNSSPGRRFSDRVQDLVSPANETYRSFLKMTDSRGIRKEGKFLLAGDKITAEVLEEFFDRVSAVIVSEDMETGVFHDLPVFRLAKKLFRELDVHGTNAPILLADLPDLPEWEGSITAGGTDVFLALQDPGNLGTAIRSAAALGASRVILLTEAAFPFHAKCIRAAGSAVFRLPLLRGPSLSDLCRRQDLPLGFLHTEGRPLADLKEGKELGIVLGVEGPGMGGAEISPENLYSLPLSRGVESLNAAMALGIALYARKF